MFEKLLPELKTNVLLKDYTTFKIGGPAKYFCIVKTKHELIKAIKMARTSNLPFFILGGGSKLLVSDNGFNGVVIKNEIHEIEIKEGVNIYAGAGALLWDTVRFALKQSLSGIEWAIGIPGTIGGAVRGNAAAFNGFMKDIVKSVQALDCLTLKVKEFSNEECQFSVKNSIFKQNKNLIILSAEIQLKKGNQDESKKKIQEYLKLRKQKQPLEFASAGCIFVNPESEPAGLLIDKCGLKGTVIGNAQISEKHANFIVNLGDAKADDVLQLIQLAKEKVSKKFSIELIEEIQYLGF